MKEKWDIMEIRKNKGGKIMSWYFEKITTEEKEKMEKMIEIINEKINEETFLTVYLKEHRITLYLQENDEIQLHYDADSLDIDEIEFKLHTGSLSPIESYDLKYLSVEYDDGNIVSAVFYLKDKITSYHIDF